MAETVEVEMTPTEVVVLSVTPVLDEVVVIESPVTTANITLDEVVGPAGQQGPQGAQGVQGLQGIQGIQGEKGDPGLSGASYIHNQLTPSNIWVITHNLGRFPVVAVVDSGGTVVYGDIHYDSSNQLTVTFGAAFAGLAYLS